MKSLREKTTCVHFLLVALALPVVLPICSAAAEDLPDPAATLLHDKLTADEAKHCRELFKLLASDDFDAREKATNELTALGTAVLEVAAEFNGHADPEIASQARSFSDRILRQYDGYLPTSPALKAAMAAPLTEKIDSEGRKIADILKAISEKQRIKIVIDSADGPPDFVLPARFFGTNVTNGTVGQVLNYIGAVMQLESVTRGDTLLYTSHEKAQRLSVQRQTFDWSGVEITRDEAERVGKALVPFFPAGDTDLTTSSEVLLVRGREGCIPRAARLIALLKPGSPDGILPPVTAGGQDLVAQLAQPVDFSLRAEEPLNVIPILKRQKIEIYAASALTNVEGLQKDFPRELDAFAPLRLSLKQMPLGLALRWIERRSKIITSDQSEMKMAYTIDTSSRLTLRLQQKTADVLTLAVAGADVSFLYPKGAVANAASDSDVKKQIVAALESHMALLPKMHPEFDIAVIRGRLLMQAPGPALQMLLPLIAEWRKTRQPPAPAAWRKQIDDALAATVDWTGHDVEGDTLTGGKLLPTLRALGKFNILLEDATDGSAGTFQLSAKDAQLLPPGKHTLKELLDDVAERTGAQWQVDLGAITITPKSKK